VSVALLYLSACAPSAQLSAQPSATPTTNVVGQNEPRDPIAAGRAATTGAIAWGSADPCDAQAQQKIAAARQQQIGGVASMLLVPYAAPVLLKTQQDTFDMIERERQQCHQDAKAAIAQEREQARAREQRIRLQEREYPATVRRGSSAVAAPMEPKPTNHSGQQKTIDASERC